MQVTHDNQPNEIGKQRTAQVNGITFGAFPYQPYLSNVSNVTAKVFSHKDVMQDEFEASVILYKNLPNGDSEAIHHEHYKTFDEAFFKTSMKLNGYKFIPFGA